MANLDQIRWQQKGRYSLRKPKSDPIVKTLNQAFTSPLIKIQASSRKLDPRWRACGHVYQQLPEKGSLNQLQLTKRYLPFGIAIFTLPPANYYRLRFEAMPWLDNVTLAVWEARNYDPSVENLMQGVLLLPK